MGAASKLLEIPLSYRLWQAPFAEAKFAPIRRHNDLAAVRRVLDVGCGPGTNARHFAGTDYTGIDLNEKYLEFARSRHTGTFIAADATEFTVPASERFDFVLVNSFLHHIDDELVRLLLRRLSTVVAEGGHIHVLELELPERPSVARLLTRMDRGDHARSPTRWRELLSESFAPVIFEHYPLGGWGGQTTLWKMLYLKGSVLNT